MLNIHYFGHSFFKIEAENCAIYFDPYFVPEKRLCNPKKPCLVLVSHEHPENFSAEFIEKITKKNNSLVCVNSYLLNKLEKISVYKKRGLKANTAVNIFGTSIKAVPVHHPNSFDPWGFEIELDGKKLFHSGDTFLSKAFTEVKANILMLPIGGETTMDVVDAVRAVKTMKPNYVIPMRFSHLKRFNFFLEEFCGKIKKSILKSKPLILRPGESSTVK